MFCPDCPTAREARALVLDDQPLLHLAGVLVPFVLVALVVSMLIRRLDRGGRE